MLHEALGLLMTKGVVSAGKSLKNQNDFCGELSGGILATVEEVDISKTPGALNKIKDMVTSAVILIRKMPTDAYPVPNSLHFIQTANSANHCPVFPGDTRHHDDVRRSVGQRDTEAQDGRALQRGRRPSSSRF